jgi:hypothetical protein
MPVPQTTTDILAANMEAVSKVIPEAYEKENETLYGDIKKASKDQKIALTVNGADFRQPIRVRPAGTFGAFTPGGGAMGIGHGSNIQQFTQTYFPLRMAFSLNLDVNWNTDGNPQSVVSEFSRTVKEAIPSFQGYADKSFHNITGNQGLCALATNWAVGTSTYTFDPEFGANLLQEGMDVEIFDNALAVHKTAAVPGSLPRIAAVNKEAGTAVIENLPGGFAGGNDDYLAFPGCGAIPTWLNGLEYFMSTATTGLLLGLNRATYPGINPSAVNVAGPIVPQAGWVLKARLKQRFGGKAPKLRGYCHIAQAAAIANLTVAVTMFDRAQSDKKILDIMPDIDRPFEYCGVTHKIDMHASKQRIYWLDPANWTRVYSKDLGFLEEPGSGRKFFLKRDTNGQVVHGVDFFLTLAENFAVANPGNAGLLYGLTIPADM